jgi:hypothetical protein
MKVYNKQRCKQVRKNAILSVKHQVMDFTCKYIRKKGQQEVSNGACGSCAGNVQVVISGVWSGT